MDFHFQAISYDRSRFVEEVLAEIQRHSAVFKIFDPLDQLIILDRTHNLFERLERYYRPRSALTLDLDLAEITNRIEFCRTDSPFETLYLLYRERRRFFPQTYRDMRTFRLFPLMKINRRQRFPRIYASHHVKRGVEYFGPFLSRTHLEKLKTTLERTFRLRPCLYNIRGDDPHPDCLYFQMHTCSRPCNNDIDRANYLDCVDEAIAFVQGRDEDIRSSLMAALDRLAQETQFEQAEVLRRKLDRIRRARAEIKDTFFNLWEFNFVALLPADSVTRCRLAFIREGYILGFEEYDVETIEQSAVGDLHRYFALPLEENDRKRQYDEFCLTSNFLVSPVQNVELIAAEDLSRLPAAIVERIRARKRKRKQPHVDPVA